MKTSIIAAAAFALVGLQGPGLSTKGDALASSAYADSVQRYEGGSNLQHMSAPQRTQALAQEGGRGGETMYGRRMAQAEGGRSETMYGRTYSQGDAPGAQYGRRYAQADSPGAQYGQRQAQAEQTGVNNARLG